jgi:hypothetical protein
MPPQLVVTQAHGLDVGDALYNAPRVSPLFPHEELPPAFMASLPRYVGEYPVFDDVFRLDGICPSSEAARHKWLRENAVIEERAIGCGPRDWLRPARL